jgi:RNA polymerase sigma-70 factor (ECF subfamily)
MRPIDDAHRATRFIQHLEPHQGALEAYCRCALTDRDAVWDVLQSAVANAFRDFAEFREGSNFRAWVFRYVTFEVRNQNRRAAGDPVCVGDGVLDWDDHRSQPDRGGIERLLDSPESVLEGCDETLAEAIGELPEGARSMFLLRAVGELRYREIAEVLGVPVGTVMASLSRSRDRLRQRLARWAREERWLPGDVSGPE